MGKLVKTLIPLQHLWSCLLGRPLVARVHEDNQAAIAVAKSGFSIALRHLAKHQRLNLGFLHDCFSQPERCMVLEHIDSENQKADILTKALQRHAFDACLRMIGICKQTAIAAVGFTVCSGVATVPRTRKRPTLGSPRDSTQVA